MDSRLPEFWIDVGGTFTDCFLRRADGALQRFKLLSSGVIKGAAAEGSSAGRIVDSARRADPPGFFDRWRLRLLDAAGEPLTGRTVQQFDPATASLHLDAPLPAGPTMGQSYELSCDLEAPLIAIRYLLGAGLDEPLPRVVVKLGTTRGTNALLTRQGAATGLVTTRGFGDILEIGYQHRPRIFALNIEKPTPLYAEVVEVDQRIAADGRVLKAPSTEEIAEQLRALKDRGIESLAICLLNGYACPQQEQDIEAVARQVGFEEISLSSRVAPLIKIVSRGDTTVVDAYLNPVLRSYVQQLRRTLGQSELRIMTSAGGLVDADHFVGKDSILSGPAGGVVGFSRVAELAGFPRAIGFDMGGTSTDVSRYDGRYELEYETEKAGIRVVAPMMAIETVAAGGGSVCHFDGVKLVVGPQSAGADPGPACYGRGGPLAVTDLNFFLGRILPEHFPFPLSRDAVAQRLEKLIGEIHTATGKRYDPIQLCDGFLRVANASMVKAIRSISIAKGADPREYAMVAFGGAAPQHACAVARELDIQQVLIHPDAGILSAYGIGQADVRRHGGEGVYTPYNDAAVAELQSTFDRLSQQARAEILDEGVAEDRIEVHRSLDLRYQGFDAWLTIAEPDGHRYAEEFARQHRQLYGYVHEGRPLEIVAARVETIGRMDDVSSDLMPLDPQAATTEESTTVWFDGQPQTTAVFQRDQLQPGHRFTGPAILHEARSTIVVDPHWEAEVLSRGELLLTDQGSPARVEVSRESDPVMLEIFNNQFAGIAQQMGITLRNTSSSVNVKERLDFSCAIFTPTGDLVVNAPHMPVHLGAMSETVRRIVADNPGIAPGDVYATNDPYRGGSHLPDITVVTPVHAPEGGPLLFFTANRAHHAEIGGIAPGSMPPFSKNLAEEGVLIRNFKLLDRGTSRLDELRQLLLEGPYPTRAVEENLADVRAQIAANTQGAHDLNRLIERYSLDVVTSYMGHIQAAAQQKMRHSLARLPDGRHTFKDHLDDGSPIQVAVTIRGDEATIDFSGTGPVLAGNLNANRAIVTAAVMYCLRLLIDEDIPLNQGVLAPVQLRLPPCLLNPPEAATPQQSAAVVGGNVETSQRVVDVLLGALKLSAASQGSMNNLLFGDATFGYYETICGGAGATSTADGASAVHTHMTNTRLTDPEVLEQRYPIRLRRFAVRGASGGAGRHRGGDGVLRELEFLKPLEVSILSQRRGPYPPYGLEGGQPGQLGRNTLLHADGTEEPLSARAHFHVQPGDVLRIETPGGGGFGSPE
jgi:5-oxoprolinase (ATP-hydrolysing)